jgi:purine-binding chemotaxis protein CheW
VKDPISRKAKVEEVNWDEIRRRLDAAHELSERGWTPSHEESKAILKERAKALAREPEAGDGSEETIELVEFLLAQEHYGIESAYVREVCPLRHYTPVPCTPTFVLGIINVRGQILSVVDLKKFFDLPEKGLSELNKVIIIHNENMEFGILADRILAVRSIPLEEIRPAPATLSGIGAEYLRGIARERLVVLAAERILADRNIVVHE